MKLLKSMACRVVLCLSTLLLCISTYFIKECFDIKNSSLFTIFAISIIPIVVMY